MAVKVLTAQDIILSKNGVVVGCQQSATLNLSREQLDAVCASSGGWKQSAKGMKSWSLELDAILREATLTDAATNYTFHDAFDDFDGPDDVEIEFTIGSFVYSGMASHTGLTASTDQAGSQTWSTSLDGNGPLTKTAVA